MNKAKKDTTPRQSGQITHMQSSDSDADSSSINHNMHLNVKSQDSEKTKIASSIEGGDGDTCSQSEYSQDFGTESVYGSLSQVGGREGGGGTGTEGSRTPIPEESDRESLGQRARKMAFDKEVILCYWCDVMWYGIVRFDIIC